MKNLFTCFFILSLGIVSLPLEATNVTSKNLVGDCTYKTGNVTTTRSNCSEARRAHITKLQMLGIIRA